jgi:tetratricopeptide (TPR) repeat protein
LKFNNYQGWVNPVIQTQYNLGNSYSARIHGEHADNLEAAIACYIAASQVYSDEASLDWAIVQDELGNAYCDRIFGDWVQNQEAAMNAFQSALLVYSPEEFPDDWARTQNNLATIYSGRHRGDKAENLELAIQACENALQIYNRFDFPDDWAMVQTNLGAAYRVRVKGDFAENIEMAIHCYNAALSEHNRENFPEDWAGLQNNLGNAYRERIRGTRTENLKQSVCYFKAALLVYTRESFPKDWAMLHNNLGLTYYDMQQIEKAIAFFKAALEICTPVAFPVDCLEYAGELGDKSFAQGLWTEAIEGYGLAIKVIEQTRNWVSEEARRQEILQDDISLYENMVQACVNNGQLDQAIEYVERSRSRRLVDLMASNDLYQGGEIPLEVKQYLEQFEAIQKQIDSERLKHDFQKGQELTVAKTSSRQSIASTSKNRAALEALSETVAALETQKQQVWGKLRQIDPVLAGQIQVSAPDFTFMQQLIDQPTTAIVNFYATNNNILIFVLKHNQITCYCCTELNKNSLQKLINTSWLQVYLTKKEIWKGQISFFLSELAKLLHLDELITQHLTSIQEIIFIPHLHLH